MDHKEQPSEEEVIKSVTTECILISLSFSDDRLLPEMILESPSTMEVGGRGLVQLCCVQF